METRVAVQKMLTNTREHVGQIVYSLQTIITVDI